MKNTTLLGIALVCIAALSGVSVNATGTGGNVPADLCYECPNGNVTLSHAKHAASHPDCADCHPQPFEMKKTDMGFELGHASCAKCHSADGEAFDVLAPDKCTVCHVL